MFNKLKKYSIVVFFILLFFPQNVFAESAVVVNEFPEEIMIGSEFDVEFAATGLGITASYYAKVRIGEAENHLVYGETFNVEWLGDTAGWVLFPIIIANDSGNLESSIKVKTKLTTTPGENFLVISLRKVGTETNISSSPVTISLLPAPTSTPTPSPTNAPVPTATSTPIQKAIYKINDIKKSDGTIITGVKIYVDNSYIHHEDNEVLEFCNGCHCDPGNNVDCGFGEHTIKLTKDGYSDWSETKNLTSGTTYETNPIMSPISPTSTPVLTLTPLPTAIPTVRPTSLPTSDPTPSILDEGQSTFSGEEVLGSESAVISDNSTITTENKPKTKINYISIILIASGTGLIGFSVYSLLKAKDGLPKQTLV